jgi:hypothetical protein
MDFLDWNVSSLPEAHLAKRMLVNVSITNSFPSPAVSFAGGVTTGEVFVLFLRQLLVLLAVLFTVLTKIRTAGEAAGTFRFHWHCAASFQGIRKAPEGLLLSRLVSAVCGFLLFFSLSIYYHEVRIGVSGQSRTFPATFRS